MTTRYKIAIAVGDDAEIWPKHFGEAPRYDIYDESGRLLEQRINPYGPGGEQKPHHTPQPIADLLSDCAVFIARAMGGPSKRKLLEHLGVTPVIVDAADPRQALEQYLSSSEGQA